MDDFLYVAASGAREAMLAQAINSNNLAHASTTGFRADLASAQSIYVSGEGQNSRVFGNVSQSAVDFTKGVINSTGRELDVAVNGNGWIAVQAADGSEAYTRRGDLHITELGQLVNGAGQPVVGDSGPLALPPFSEIAIGGDGTVSIVGLGEDPNALSAVGQIKLVNLDQAQMRKGEDGLLRLPEGSATPTADAGVKLLSGSLEASNVSTVASMVNMIELARKFESYVKIMGTAEEMDRASAELMSLT
jgi:flagellar basal-body rod protein FlgF